MGAPGDARAESPARGKSAPARRGRRAQVAQRGGRRGGVGGGREAHRAGGTQGRAGSAQGGHTAGAGQRPPAKPVPAGCSFGGKVYALDETWHPDLGEPFGVMRCVLCACEAVSELNVVAGALASWGALGSRDVRVDSEPLSRKKRSLQVFGIYIYSSAPPPPRRESGEEVPSPSLRC